MTIHEDLKAAGVFFDHHESDLYALVCDDSFKIVEGYQFKENVTMFRSKVDGKLWYDIPFAYESTLESAVRSEG